MTGLAIYLFTLATLIASVVAAYGTFYAVRWLDAERKVWGARMGDPLSEMMQRLEQQANGK